MAFTGNCYGFPGTVAPGAAMGTWQRGLARSGIISEIDGLSHDRVTGQTRQVRVGVGTVCAGGVVAYNDAPITITLPNVTSGTRYFVIYADFRWNDDSNGYRVLITNSAAKTSPDIGAVIQTAGTRYQVPLGIYAVASGSSLPSKYSDLRVIASDAQSGVLLHHVDAAVVDLFAKPGNRTYNLGSKVARLHDGTDWVITDRPVVSSGSFGSSSAGWSTTNTAQASTIWRDFNKGHRLMYLEQKRTSSSDISPATTGSVGNQTVFTLSDSSDRPTRSTYASASYYGSTGADYGCTVVVHPNGQVQLVHMAPSSPLAGNRDAAGLWSLRVCAEWYVV